MLRLNTFRVSLAELFQTDYAPLQIMGKDFM